jgi:putative ABC transport system substrate-binding protein
MRRREFITLLSGAALGWPFAARAQRPVMPVIGFLNSASSDGYAPMAAAFRQGLKDVGYVDGQNVAIEYRWANDQYDRLPVLAADLVHRQVAVIAATSTPAALAAKAVTTIIPIVFESGGDPVRLGLVPSLSRPGGNVTGVTQLNSVVALKRLELLHELLPNASVMALLVNPANPGLAEIETSGALSDAHSLGVELHILNANEERDFDAVFANLIQLRAAGLVIGGDPYFTSRSELLAALAARYAMPTVFENREFVAAGGLASYGVRITDAYRLAGAYVGRILKGEKPADLPVQQDTQIELFLNLKTAKALGITIPPSIMVRADELIE